MPDAPPPVHGTYASGFEPVARAFARHFERGDEIGASLAVYHRGTRVVHLWGGLANRERDVPWQESTRAVVFSCTKGLVAMALALLADRGRLDYDARVADYWPGFARGGKSAITVRTLLNHRAGLCALDTPLALADFLDPAAAPRVLDAIESQRPLWTPGEGQGYHALTYGMYARELFERVAGEPLGAFLDRELFGPLGADVSLGTPESIDARVAKLYPPTVGARLRGIGRALARRALGAKVPLTELRIAATLASPASLPRRAFENPSTPGGISGYDDPKIWRASLAWASATASADGLARAYLPFALGGEVAGRRYLKASTIAPIHERQGWSTRDAVLKKPLGWSQGFLKEETHLFSPTRASFGHPGIGGALGWCDPEKQLTIGYVPNGFDWQVRSPRALALCHAIYASGPVQVAS
jgi:CubicO group peptidase (beta-lactamase class C family)